MKRSLLIACAGLIMVGCTTERTTYRGGVNSPYETEYGRGRSSRTMTSPYLDTYDSIYPVRRQPSPNGNDLGSVRPLIDPSRQYDFWTDRVYDRDYPPRAPLPPPPGEIIP